MLGFLMPFGRVSGETTWAAHFFGVIFKILLSLILIEQFKWLKAYWERCGSFCAFQESGPFNLMCEIYMNNL